MNRADLMLSALRDGKWHTRRELHAHAGDFYLTNNAASELRARGHNVARSVETICGARIYSYRLVRPVDASSNPGEPSQGSSRSTNHRAGDGDASTDTMSSPPGTVPSSEGAGGFASPHPSMVAAAGNRDATLGRAENSSTNRIERDSALPTIGQMTIFGGVQ